MIAGSTMESKNDDAGSVTAVNGIVGSSRRATSEKSIVSVTDWAISEENNIRCVDVAIKEISTFTEIVRSTLLEPRKEVENCLP